MSDLRLSDQTLDFTENYHDNGEEIMKTSIQSEINVKLCFWADSQRQAPRIAVVDVTQVEHVT